MSDPFHKYQKAGLQHESKSSNFMQELIDLLNRHSKENLSGTPDFILANYLHRCLETYNATITARAEWRGESVELPALQKPAGKKVTLVIYEDGRRNEVGEAYISMWPGENSGEIYDVAQSVAIVPHSPSKEFVEASKGRIEAGMEEVLQESERALDEDADRQLKEGTD